MMKKLFVLASLLCLVFAVSGNAVAGPKGAWIQSKTVTLGSDNGATTLYKLSDLEANSTGWIDIPYGKPFTVQFECDSAGGDSVFTDTDSFQVRMYITCNEEKEASDSGAAEGYIEWTRFSNDFQPWMVADTSTKALYIPTALVDVAYAFKFVENIENYFNMTDSADAATQTGALKLANMKAAAYIREIPYCNKVLFKVHPLNATDSVWNKGVVAKVNVSVRSEYPE